MPSKLDAAIASLDVLVAIAKAIPVLGAPVEGSVEAAKKILEYAQGVRTNKKATSDLAQQAALWTRDVVNVVCEAQNELPKLHSLEANVREVLRVLEKIVSFQKERANQSAFKAMLRKQDDADKIIELEKELKSAYERFSTTASIRIEVAVHKIAAKVDIESMRKTLSPVFSARFDARDSPGGCMSETRTDVLRDLDDWSKDTSTKLSTFWLSGMAGTGKTTIAKTFCERLSQNGLLASSFFVSRQSAQRKDIFNIIRTISYDLTQLHPSVLEAISRTIQERPDISDRPMEEQVSMLILEPLAEYQKTTSGLIKTVIVIDALDECDGAAHTKLFLSLLTSRLRSYPIKLLITSRNEKHIRLAFETVSHDSLRLHDLEQSVVSADIRRFFQVTLSEIAHERAMAAGWPSTADIERLTELTGYLFIYAGTVIKFIQHSRFSPDEQLKIIFSVTSSGSETEMANFDRIDALYSHVLATAVINDEGKPDLRLIPRVEHLLATLITAEEPLLLRTLAGLLGTSEALTLTDCEALTAVLRIPDDVKAGHQPIRVLHPSFPDYLRDAKRCLDSRFAVQDALEQSRLASRCLDLMNSQLKPNICDTKDPNVRPEDLAAEIDKHISTELRYSCLHWVNHISRCYEITEDIAAQLLQFCKTAILPWVEALSFFSSLPSGLEALSTMRAWIEDHWYSPHKFFALVSFFYDTVQFVQTFFVPIKAHPLHCYTSVALMPYCHSHEDLAAQADSVCQLMLISAPEDGWTTQTRVFEGHHLPCTSVAFSKDNQQIISGSTDHTVRVWNAKIGTTDLLFQGHASSVNSVSVSDADNLVASGSSDKTIIIWDLTSGERLHDLIGHSGFVLSVNFSVDGSLLASGSQDCTIRIWSRESGFNSIRTLQGHNAPVESVAFTHDAALLISGSDDNSVMIWDVSRYTAKQRLLGHTGAVYSVACSPDGAVIASGSDDHTVRLWDIQSGGLLHVCDQHMARVYSVSFSKDVRRIASGSLDCTVMIWNKSGGGLLGFTKDPTAEGVRALAFSRDGNQIALACNDSTIRVWQTLAWPNSVAARLEAHSAAIAKLTITHDGRLACSASADGTALLWNVENGRMLGTLEGHTGELAYVDFSVDGNRIATASMDGIICIWSTETRCLERHLAGHDQAVLCLKFSPDGTQITSGSQDENLIIWDVNGHPRHVLLGHTDWVRSLAYSPSGDMIASCSDDETVQTWDSQTGQRIHELYGHHGSVCCVAFSMDGTRIASGCVNGTVCVWEAVSGAALATLKATTDLPSIITIKFGPNDSYLLVEHGDGEIRLLDTESYSDYKRASGLESPRTHIFSGDQSGWLSYIQPGLPPRRICWIPPVRRWSAWKGQIVSHGTRVVIGTKGGVVTILECGSLLSLFEELDIETLDVAA